MASMLGSWFPGEYALMMYDFMGYDISISISLLLGEKVSEGGKGLGEEIKGESDSLWMMASLPFLSPSGGFSPIMILYPFISKKILDLISPVS